MMAHNQPKLASVPDSDEAPAEQTCPHTQIVSAMSNANADRDDPDKTTGLVGWPKILTQLGTVGFIACLLAWMLFEAKTLVVNTLANNREDAKAERDNFKGSIHEIVTRHREDTAAIVDSLKGNHGELSEIRRLLTVQNRAGIKVQPPKED